MSDKRQKNQLVLAFTGEGRSEAPKASQEGTESLTAKCETERPARQEQLMEERAGKLLAGIQASQSEQRKSGNRRRESRRALGLPEAALALDTGTAVKLKRLKELLRLQSDSFAAGNSRSLDTPIRHRLRSMIWKQWKRGRVRFTELRCRDIGKKLAAQTASSMCGPWRVANRSALHLALPIASFDSLGLPRLFDGVA
jgi:hypothetical protein